MNIRWLPHHEEGWRMQPMLMISGTRSWFGIRFGREQNKSFSERNQGTLGIPKRWRYLLGGRISWTVKKIDTPTQE